MTAHQIEFEWIDIERDVNASIEVEEHNGGKRVVPTIVWADGTVLVEPSDRELAAKLGIA